MSSLGERLHDCWMTAWDNDNGLFGDMPAPDRDLWQRAAAAFVASLSEGDQGGLAERLRAIAKLLVASGLLSDELDTLYEAADLLSASEGLGSGERERGRDPGTSPSSPQTGDPTGWRTMESAPKGKLVLLWGLLRPNPESRELYGDLDQPMRCTGYWDVIDGAWSPTGSTWLGPWIEPTHWQPLPPPPESSDPDGALSRQDGLVRDEPKNPFNSTTEEG